MDARPQGERALVRGEKIWLRAFERSDLEAYGAAVGDVAQAPAGFRVPLGAEWIEAWFETRLRDRHGKSEYYFVVCLLGSDDFIGTTWLRNFKSRLGGAELSIFIADPAKRGIGLGTDAANAVLDFAFGSLELEKVWLTTDSDNAAAQRSFSKAGFSHDGVIRHHERRKGVWIDSALMSILREEWEALERPHSWDYTTAALQS